MRIVSGGVGVSRLDGKDCERRLAWKFGVMEEPSDMQRLMILNKKA